MKKIFILLIILSFTSNLPSFAENPQNTTPMTKVKKFVNKLFASPKIDGKIYIHGHNIRMPNGEIYKIYGYHIYSPDGKVYKITGDTDSIIEELE